MTWCEAVAVSLTFQLRLPGLYLAASLVNTWASKMHLSFSFGPGTSTVWMNRFFHYEPGVHGALATRCLCSMNSVLPSSKMSVHDVRPVTFSFFFYQYVTKLGCSWCYSQVFCSYQQPLCACCQVFKVSFYPLPSFTFFFYRIVSTLLHMWTVKNFIFSNYSSNCSKESTTSWGLWGLTCIDWLHNFLIKSTCRKCKVRREEGKKCHCVSMHVKNGFDHCVKWVDHKCAL